MRVMVLVKATANSEAGVMPSEELFAAMGAYNEDLAKAGILLDGDGLKPSRYGKRVRFSGNERKVIDGPFAETKEIIAGFWLIEVKSREEAIEWALRMPVPEGGEGVGLEIWQVFDVAEMPETSLSPETAERERALRRSMEGPSA